MKDQLVGEPNSEVPTGAIAATDRVAVILGRIASALHHAGSLVFLPTLVLVVGYDIFMRYVLVTPSIWANEISTVLLAAVFFLSLAQVTLRGEHLATDILYTRFNPKIRSVADILAGILGFVFLTVLLWEMAEGMRDSIRYREGTQNIGFPFWPVYLVIILSITITIFMFTARAVYAFVGKVDRLAKAATPDDA